MSLKIVQRPPPLWGMLLALIFLLGAHTATAQSSGTLGLEFKVALESVPPDAQLERLPASRKAQVRNSRSLYRRGQRTGEMNPAQLLQFSVDLKAHTVRSARLLKALKAKLCAVGCLPHLSDRRSCPPEQSDTACKIHCLLQYDICLMQCLLQ